MAIGQFQHRVCQGFARRTHSADKVGSPRRLGKPDWLPAALIGVCTVLLAGSEPSSPAETAPKTSAKPKKDLFRGEVRLVPDALKQLGVKFSQEELAGQVALLTPEHELLPILPDWRGRALYQDERLRDRKIELVGYRKPGLPYLQVLSIYTFDDKDQRMLTDYWCDICSIPMYEIKPCDCCQQPIRLRFQPRELPKEAHP